jgi:hypothetical protein
MNEKKSVGDLQVDLSYKVSKVLIQVLNFNGQSNKFCFARSVFRDSWSYIISHQCCSAVVVSSS